MSFQNFYDNRSFSITKGEAFPSTSKVGQGYVLVDEQTLGLGKANLQTILSGMGTKVL